MASSNDIFAEAIVDALYGPAQEETAPRITAVNGSLQEGLVEDYDRPFVAFTYDLLPSPYTKDGVISKQRADAVLTLVLALPSQLDIYEPLIRERMDAMSGEFRARMRSCKRENTGSLWKVTYYYSIAYIPAPVAGGNGNNNPQ